MSFTSVVIEAPGIDPFVTIERASGVLFTGVGPAIPSGEYSTILGAQGFGIAAGEQPFYDPTGQSAGEQADLCVSSEGTLLLLGRLTGTQVILCVAGAAGNIAGPGGEPCRIFLGGLPAPSYPAAVLADDPISYWRCNELAGATIADHVANRFPSRSKFGPAVLIDSGLGSGPGGENEYNVGPGFCKAQNGLLLVAYYKAHEQPGLGAGGTIYLATSSDAGSTWSTPVEIVAVPVGQYSLANCGLLTLQDGTVLLTSFVISDGSGGAHDYAIAVRSTDDGVTWGAPITIDTGFAWPQSGNSNPAFQLAGGDLLMPLYGADTEADFVAGTNTYVRLSKSTDGGLTWTDAGVPIPALTDWKYSESSIFSPSSGKLVLLARSDTTPVVDPLAGNEPVIVAVTSLDDGVTWSAPEIVIYGARSAPVALTTADGDTWMIVRQQGAPTADFNFAIGTYDGRTWGQCVGLDQGTPSGSLYGAMAEIGPPGADGSLAGVWAQEVGGFSSGHGDIYFQAFTAPQPQPHGGNPGTLSGAYTLSAPSPLPDDVAAAAILFSGGHADVPASPSVQGAIARNVFTLEAWMYNTGSGRKLIAGTSYAGLGLDNAVAFFGGFTEVSTTVDPTANAWHHVAAVCEAGTIALYLDGFLSALAGGDTASPSHVYSDLLIGGDLSGHNFAGNLAEVAFYDQALSAGRILAHYAAGVAIGPPATVSVSLAPASIQGNGTSTTLATATVSDSHGLPIAGQTVTFTSSDTNAIGPTTDHGDGTYTATITSTATVESVTITAHDGALSGNATLTQTAGPGGYATEVMADSPLAYYRLDETSGTTAADQTGSHDGTYSGDYTLDVPGATSDGDPAVLVSPHGGGGGVGVPDDAAFHFGTGDFSLECWVNTATLPSSGPQGSLIGRNASNEFYLGLDASGHANLYTYPTGGITGSVDLTDGMWHHLAGVRDSGTLLLYVDGAEVATGSSTDNVTDTVPIQIANGGGGQGLGSIHCDLDEVAIYGHALSGARVLDHFTHR